MDVTVALFSVDGNPVLVDALVAEEEVGPLEGSDIAVEVATIVRNEETGAWQ